MTKSTSVVKVVVVACYVYVVMCCVRVRVDAQRTLYHVLCTFAVCGMLCAVPAVHARNVAFV